MVAEHEFVRGIQGIKPNDESFCSSVELVDYVVPAIGQVGDQSQLWFESAKIYLEVLEVVLAKILEETAHNLESFADELVIEIVESFVDAQVSETHRDVVQDSYELLCLAAFDTLLIKSFLD